MDHLDNVTELPEDFDSRVRLSPLPGLVVFPHAMQPLHIFEPRYCELLAESLASDQLIAMATLTGGIAAFPKQQPPIASDVCICKIISHSELEDDRHNVLLVGIRRATIIQEIDAGRPFRIAEVDVKTDVYSPSKAESRTPLKQELLDAFASVIPASANVQQNLHELMAGHMGLGPITDIIGYTLPFDVEAKLKLLTESDVDDRAKLLIHLLSTSNLNLHSVSVEEQQVYDNPTDGGKFPPPFSLN